MKIGCSGNGFGPGARNASKRPSGDSKNQNTYKLPSQATFVSKYTYKYASTEALLIKNTYKISLASNVPNQIYV